jgi:hypothetical protein
VPFMELALTFLSRVPTVLASQPSSSFRSLRHRVDPFGTICLVSTLSDYMVDTRLPIPRGRRQRNVRRQKGQLKKQTMTARGDHADFLESVTCFDYFACVTMLGLSYQSQGA